MPGAGDLPTDTTWVHSMGMEVWVEEEQMGRLYIVALYVSIVAMFGGVGSVSPSNTLEYVVLILCASRRGPHAL